VLDDTEQKLLLRERASHAGSIVWSSEDVPLLDEALELLGPRPRHKEDDVIRTYGHIVVDEAQDLSPMELRVIDRRSLNGSMTIVGDIAQATAAHGHDSWASVLEHLPDKREPRFAELTIGYRLPGPSMDLAARLLHLAAPGLTPPRSIRQSGDAPIVQASTEYGFPDDLAAAVKRELEAVGSGNLAVIAPASWLARVEAALDQAGVEFGRAHRGNLDHQVTVAPVTLVKGLELDACIVVEPGAILDEEFRGPQTLYVALTRATRRLSLLHVGPLPEVLATEG
jgi:DNA helicase IV